ncbi:sugar kinase [soil metagenome]
MSGHARPGDLPHETGATAGREGERRPLVVVGDFAWDVLIRTATALQSGGDTFGEVRLAPGGSAANVAVWARRCGLDTTFVGKIGRDRFGVLAEENLREERVEAFLVRAASERTGSVAVWIDHAGQRSMVSGKGADHALLPEELPTELIGSARHLHLTAWSFFDDPPRAAAREAARIARDAGATISLDPGSFQMIEEMGVDTFLSVTADLGIDLFFPNAQEAATLTGERDPERMAVALRERYGGAAIALKLDADGAYVLEADAASGTAITPTANRLVDATGAGDAFAGAYLSRRLGGVSAVEAAHFAVEVSEWVIGRVGARPAVDATLRRYLSDELAP